MNLLISPLLSTPLESLHLAVCQAPHQRGSVSRTDGGEDSFSGTSSERREYPPHSMGLWTYRAPPGYAATFLAWKVSSQLTLNLAGPIFLAAW